MPQTTVLRYGKLVLQQYVLNKFTLEGEQMPTVTVRLTNELRDQVSAAADTDNVSVSDYIRGALETHLSLVQGGEVGSGRPSRDDSDVSMTPFERKVLQLLHRNLLASQGDLASEYYDSEQEVKSLAVLENGFAGEYAEEFTDILDPLGRAECELVWDIFDMFRVIGSSVRELGKDGWNQLAVEDAEHLGSFQGFDFNDSLESRLGSYARFLIKTDRWTEQQESFTRENDFGNSHMQMLPTYRAMLRVFKPLWRTAIRGGFSKRHLSAQQLEQILLAAPGASRTGEK